MSKNEQPLSFNSDGQSLNAKFFFHNPVSHKPSNNFTAYRILINADSDPKTGWLGYDYMMRISWDSIGKNWTYLVQEWSSVSLGRELLKRENFTDFYNEDENKTIHLSLDLNQTSSPKQYVVVFFTDYDFRGSDVYHQMSDFSNSVYILPPHFAIATFPNSVEMRPGDEN